MSKRVSFINTMGDIAYQVGEEQELYFNKDFLIKKYLGMSPDELKKNETYKKLIEKEVEEKAKAAGAAAPAEGSEPGAGEDTGGGFTL
jgi:hypothetical protein